MFYKTLKKRLKLCSIMAQSVLGALKFFSLTVWTTAPLVLEHEPRSPELWQGGACYMQIRNEGKWSIYSLFSLYWTLVTVLGPERL